MLAERCLPTNPGLNDECSTCTTQVVQLVWAGGVSGPNGAPLQEPQRLGVSVQLEGGNILQPIALADDDPDHYVYACLDAMTPLVIAALA